MSKMPRAWAVGCPRCGTPAGESCKYPNGTLRASHKERIGAYLKSVPDEDDEEDVSNNSGDNARQTVNTG